MKRAIRTWIVIGLGSVIWPLAAEAQFFGVYETWETGTIRSDRWRGDEDFGGQEVGREVLGTGRRAPGQQARRGRSGTLRMRFHVDGFIVAADPPAGTGGNISNRISFAAPTSINAVRAVFTVPELTLVPCADNNAGAATRARPAQILLAKFDDGSSSGPGDRTGDHFAGIQAHRDGSSADPDGVMTVVAFINHFTSANGGAFVTDASAVLGQVNVGDRFTLQVVWDKPNKQFLFRLNGGETTPLAYAASDSAEAVVPFADIRQNFTPANCHDAAAGIDATTLVGNVHTNNSAVIP